MEENPATPSPLKVTPHLQSPGGGGVVNSQSSSSHPGLVADKNANGGGDSTPTKNPQTPKEFILSAASKIAAQPLQNADPEVWGVLTAISDAARKRPQGMNMMLVSNEHIIGRLVKDVPFRINSPAISGNHCKIFRRKGVASEDNASAFLKDSSTNGTYVNWEKLTKGDSDVKLCHGDIVSIAFPPEHVSAFAFVFREVLRSSFNGVSPSLKRKSDEPLSESKKLKGIGIGTTEGPLSLDDFKSLQRSNMELRKQLEEHVVTIETLRKENRMAIERHEIEMKELKESISEGYVGKVRELQELVETKENELTNNNRISAEQRHALDDLNERLDASMQSCVEANEVISSQKTTISELKALLSEEREQRKEEREKAATDLKTSIQRIQAEAQDELRRLSDGAEKREKEMQEIINKLQESEKERCLLVETLRSKLEDTREKLVVSDNKVRQLEAQVREEQLTSVTNRKKVDEVELDIKRLRKELENEKATREEAWAKVSALELEINAAMRDLDFERRRFLGARERIMLRETQLRAFYSTTEEIQGLFAKQQEQLKAMQRTLEDEEDHQTTSVDFDLNLPNWNTKESFGRKKEVNDHYSGAAKALSTTATRSNGRDRNSSSSDEVSVTEKHDCMMKNRGNDDDDTQEVEFAGIRHSVEGAFGSDINGVVGTVPIPEADLVGTEKSHEADGNGIETAVGTVPIPEADLVGTEKSHEADGNGIETAPILEGDLAATEALLENGAPRSNGIDLNKSGAMIEDTVEMDDEANGEAMVQDQMCSTEKLQLTDSIRTCDLLASEVPGSWANETGPSNDSEKSKDLPDSIGIVPETQNVPSLHPVGARSNKEHEMHGEPEMPDSKENERIDISDSDTEGCSSKEDSDHEARTDAESDDETIGSDGEKKDPESDDAMDEDDDTVGQDSYG